MKVAALRRIDRYVGIPLCAFLTLVRRVKDLFLRRPAGPVESILFVKLAEQGSTVLAYGALRMAVERVGREQVYSLVFEENRAILDVLGMLPPDNVIVVRHDSLGTAIMSSLAAVRRLRSIRPDVALDLEFFARSSAAFSYLSGAPRRIGLHAYHGDGPYRGDLMTHRLMFNPHVHTSRMFELTLEAINADPDRLPAFDGLTGHSDNALPPITFSKEDNKEFARIMQKTAGDYKGSPMIILNANCSDLLPLRRWAPPRYVELAKRLLAAYPELLVVFTGSPEEVQPTEQLVKEVADPRCVSVAGSVDLRQLLCLFSHAAILVTNDSGPAHFAALTSIDIITLFGPESPALFAAPGPRSHCLCAGLACSPCVSAYNNRLSSCRDNLCMKAITVDEVFSLASRIYETRTKRTGSA